MVNARLTEKYGADFGVTMPDEHHFQCTKIQLNQKYSSEAALDKGIIFFLQTFWNFIFF